MDTDHRKLHVECAVDCGNAPKKELLKEFTIAIFQNNKKFCLEWITDDIVWDIIGYQCFKGKNEWLAAFRQTNQLDVQELHIHNIITHGNVASLNGTLILDEGQKIAFCDVYRFSSFGKKAKIKTVTSYVIPVP
mgnify:CR=1 FL=1